MTRREHLPNGLSVLVDETCAFGTDAVLLAAFAAPKPRERVCDLGTGCGILPLLWQSTEGGPRVDAVECWPATAALAARSVAENGLQERITVWEQSWNDLTLPAGAYDRVTCNPPYFPAGSGKTSLSAPRRLARHETGDTLQEVVGAAARLLRVGGHFCLCHRPERLPDVLATLREQGLEPKRLQWCHGRVDLPPFLFLCDAVRGGRPSLTVLPPMITAEGDDARSAIEKETLPCREP